MPRIFIAFFGLCSLGLWGQGGIVVQPIAGEVDFAGTFGELRSHHFHSGVDVRTQGQTGWPVRAVQDGYLSRMVVRPDGFGWALYLRHPDGHTSVYAHLDDFQPSWHELAMTRAAASRSSRLDLYFESNAYPVRAGDTIAWSGNSGGSAGPHLHFEWRDTRTEEPLDPFDHGMFYGKDSYPPRIVALHTADGQKAPVASGEWSTPLRIQSWQDLSAEIKDKKHAQGLNLGIEALEVHWTWGGEEASHGFHLDRFSFDDTRCADGLMQPQVHRRTGLRTYRLAPSLGAAPVWSAPYKSVTAPGRYTLTLTARAVNGDLATARGPVDLLPGSGHPWSDPGVANKVDIQAGERVAEDLKMTWSRGSFTDPLVPELVKTGERSWKASPDVPILRALRYEWTPPADYPVAWRTKTVMIGRDPRGSYRIVGEPLLDGRIRFNMKLYGTLTIVQDTEGPTFTTLKTATFQGRPAWYIGLRDNLLDITHYGAEINGQWTWSYYDAKNKRLYIPQGAQRSGSLTLFAQDEAGNRTTFDGILP